MKNIRFISNFANQCVVVAISFLLSCSTFFAVAMVTTFSSGVLAESTSTEGQAKKNSRVKRSATMRPAIYKRLEAVRELADQKEYVKASEKLSALDKLKRNSYEKAQTFNMQAYVAFNQENYAEAAKAYEKVLKTKNLPKSLQQTTQYSLAKLYLIQENYTEALGSLNAWFELVEKPGAESHILKAQILYQLERFDQALPEVKKAIAIIENKGQMPRENWLLIERAVYYQNKDYQGLERSLKDLLAYYPKAQYWVQLSAVYNELGQSEKELSALETAFDQNLLLNESQIVSLAQAFISQNIPYKSAQVLLKGMKEGVVEETAKNLSLLGDALMIAKEYDAAIEVMSRAANASHKAKDYYKLAQIHAERQSWDLALKNISQAIELGDLDNSADARILKGLVLFNMKRLDQAQTQFELAEKDKVKQKVASQWLSYISSEKKRIEYMAQIL